VTGAVASFVTAGADMVAGLVKGILSGGASVINAAKQIAQSAVDAAKSVLGIASPSKVFAAIGDNTVEGFVDSVDAGRDAAHTAVADMTRPPADAGGGATTNTTHTSNTTSSSATTIVIERVELPNVTDADSFLFGLEALAARAS